MHNTVKRAFLLLIVVGAFLAGFVVLVFSFIQHGNEWVTHRANAHLYTNGQVTSAGTIYDVTGAILAQTKDSVRFYNEDEGIRKATLHALSDKDGFMSTGIHAQFETELTGYDALSGAFYLAKYGVGNDVNLTLNAEVCKAALNAMNGRKGTVGVYNYKTGEIICMLSTPTYDPDNKPDSETMETEEYNSVYINKFLSSTFTPGSIFKVVTAYCAIENIQDIDSRTFTCTGELKVGGTEVICNGVHGKQSFEKALNNSCNSAFAEVAIELGRDKLEETAKEMGIASSFTLDRTQIAKGSIDLSKAVDIDMGWAGIGQYTTKVNPCMMMTLMGAVANEGDGVYPYYVKSIVSPNGSVIYKAETVEAAEIKMSSSTVREIQKLLRSNVKNYYGDSSFPNLKMCGKTGTAEVGDGTKGDNAWFIGYSENDNFPYAVVVLIENSFQSGRAAAIPVANAVLQSTLKNFGG